MKTRSANLAECLLLAVMMAIAGCSSSVTSGVLRPASQQSAVPPPTSPQPVHGVPLHVKVLNPQMSLGSEIPQYWTGHWGDAVGTRDIKVFRSKPASLQVSVAADKSGMVFQTLPGGSNGEFTVSGWFKTEGDVRAQVFVQAFSDGYAQNQFHQVTFAQGTNDWSHFQGDVTLPPWTTSFNIGVLAEGNGRAWIDDIRTSP